MYIYISGRYSNLSLIQTPCVLCTRTAVIIITYLIPKQYIFLDVLYSAILYSTPDIPIIYHMPVDSSQFSQLLYSTQPCPSSLLHTNNYLQHQQYILLSRYLWRTSLIPSTVLFSGYIRGNSIVLYQAHTLVAVSTAQVGGVCTQLVTRLASRVFGQVYTYCM